MKRILALMVVVAFVISCLWIESGFAGGGGSYKQSPELDYSLMGFKEQGVWYFPCVAPQYPVKTAPCYVTYGPPPPCAPPAPCAPPIPAKIK
jgi:hypothetical protein